MNSSVSSTGSAIVSHSHSSNDGSRISGFLRAAARTRTSLLCKRGSGKAWSSCFSTINASQRYLVTLVDDHDWPGGCGGLKLILDQGQEKSFKARQSRITSNGDFPAVKAIAAASGARPTK